jgi:predicted dehydrogenase
MASKRIVHIGTGPWGQNYIRTLKELSVEVTVANRDSWQSLIDARPDGVIVCTPPDTHIQIAAYALERNIPVMIEKPLALSVADAALLCNYDVPILVNHLYLFSTGYQTLKSALAETPISRIETIGIGTKAHAGYSALWDYGPHDVAMILDLTRRTPKQVSAKDLSSGKGAAFELELVFDTCTTRSHIGVGLRRERRVDVMHGEGGSFFEDVGIERPGPLHKAIEVFLGAIEGKSDDRIGLTLPLAVLQVLEACERSLRDGEPVVHMPMESRPLP